MATKKKLEEEIIEEKEVKAEEDKVTIMVPYIEGEDPDLTVGINGVFTKIKRGVLVEVSRPIAEVIENANQQMIVSRANRAKFKNQRTDL